MAKKESLTNAQRRSLKQVSRAWDKTKGRKVKRRGPKPK